MPNRMILTCWLVLGAAGAVLAQSSQTVVFVCEHGAAKSVIAAAHFNRLASERGLPFRAISRGTVPDPAVPPPVRNGLQSDGAPIDPAFVPTRVQSADASTAVQVVTFDVKLPTGVTAKSVANWTNVPAVSDGYAGARADIVNRVESLLNELVKNSRPKRN
jgi:arsenate reductase (thioredoxin)